MNKNLIIIVIAVLLVCVGLSGCIEEKSTEKLVTAPVNTLALTVDDLPEGFSEVGNKSLSSVPVLADSPTESYAVIFLGNYSNQTIIKPEIHFGLLKFNSSEVASNNYNTLILYFTTYSDDKLIDDSINKTGDESKAFSNFTGSIHYYFRVSNVVGIMNIYGNNSYSFAFDLVKIVEDRILESMD